jgi:hypothetical protein
MFTQDWWAVVLVGWAPEQFWAWWRNDIALAPPKERSSWHGVCWQYWQSPDMESVGNTDRLLTWSLLAILTGSWHGVCWQYWQAPDMESVGNTDSRASRHNFIALLFDPSSACVCLPRGGRIFKMIPHFTYCRDPKWWSYFSSPPPPYAFMTLRLIK